MRIRANIWHLIDQLYQLAAWRIFITKSVQASSESADRGRSIIQVNYIVVPTIIPTTVLNGKVLFAIFAIGHNVPMSIS